MRSQTLAIFIFTSLILGLVSRGNGQEKKKDEKVIEAPKILMAIPPYLEPGKTTKVLLRGKQLDQVTAVESGRKPVKILRKGKAGVPKETSAAKVGETEAEIELIAGNQDFIEITTKTEGKSSIPFKLPVRNGVIAEKEPNQGFLQAQEIKVPCLVYGKIQAVQDVDVYQIKMPQGTELHIKVNADKIGSALDGILTVYDVSGKRLYYADDLTGSRDSILRIKMPESGVVNLCIQDAHDLGGDLFRYLLEIEVARK